MSPKVGTDYSLIAGLKSRATGFRCLRPSPGWAPIEFSTSYVNIFMARTLFVRMMPSRRPSPSASRMRTVAVLNDQEG